ncbi:unnamed protein product [Caenorhabditis sp. 36 PRJEB53466]|nr:unnamed protein product [Caenorhabditis sp. 36 PRJEB53466]
MSIASPCFGFNDGGDKLWWTNVVVSTLLDCSPMASRDRARSAAESLYEFYATSEPWELVESNVKLTLQKLRLKGIHLVVTSNFDRRLKPLLLQFELHELFSMMVLSGEVMDLFRKPTKKRNFAGRRDGDSSDDDTEVKDIVRKRRRTNPMVQSTKKSNHRQQKSSDDSDDSDQDVAVATHSFAATGDTGPAGPRDQGATATLEVDTDYIRDAQAQFERVQQQLKEGVEKDGKILYKGVALYGAKEAKDTAKGNASSGYNRVGPVRAPQFLRQTVRWDFAPDICKDYKETGFCTFGDSCKFVHDRSDYKHGWEIDEEYEAGKYGEEDDTNYEIRGDDDTFPEDCFICGRPFVDPIVTKCKHYFCGSCAIKAFQRSSKCPVCHQNTEKIMNAARDLMTFLKRKEQSSARQEKQQSEDEPDEGGCEGHNHEYHEAHQDEPAGDTGEEEDVGEHQSDVEKEIIMEDVDDVNEGENQSESDESVDTDG